MCGLKVVLMVLVAGVILAQDESGPRLTAREIFYGAKPPEAPVKVTASVTPVKKPVEKAATNKPSRPTASSSAELPVRLASDTTSSAAGLAMRWSITQRMPDGTKKEVDASKP